MNNLKNSALPRALSDVVADLSDLFQKEIRLARAELSEKLSLKVRAGGWILVAGVLGLVAALVLVEAAIFAIASAFNLGLHWSCLIVGGALLAAAAGAYAVGRSAGEEELYPSRTAAQVKQDIAIAKEQLT